MLKFFLVVIHNIHNENVDIFPKSTIIPKNDYNFNVNFNEVSLFKIWWNYSRCLWQSHRASALPLSQLGSDCHAVSTTLIRVVLFTFFLHVFKLHIVLVGSSEKLKGLIETESIKPGFQLWKWQKRFFQCFPVYFLNMFSVSLNDQNKEKTNLTLLKSHIYSL